jgi:MYXO-CTERM domain-containing protein
MQGMIGLPTGVVVGVGRLCLLLLVGLGTGCEDVVVRDGAQPITARQEGSRLVGSDSGPGSRFGWAVDIDGDSVVIGAPGEVSTEAYIFVREGSEWVEQALFDPPDPELSGDFGSAVAIDGDTVLIGDPLDDEHAEIGGAVFVYVRTGEDWSLQRKLVSPDPGFNEAFGASVALAGDDALIGVPAANNSLGGVYHYRRTGTAWSFVRVLGPLDPISDSRFGTRLAMDAETVVIGEPEHSASSGKAYVATRSGGEWGGLMELDTGPDDPTRIVERLGDSVAVSGDHIVVGGPGRSVGSAEQVGVAHLYTRDGEGWERQEILTGVRAAGAGAGWSVAVDQGLVAISVRETPVPAVYTYVEGDTGWVHDGTANATTGDTSLFGTVALSDGRMVVGAAGEDSSTGAAYVYTLEGAPGIDDAGGCGCRSTGRGAAPLLVLAALALRRRRGR